MLQEDKGTITERGLPRAKKKEEAVAAAAATTKNPPATKEKPQAKPKKLSKTKKMDPCTILLLPTTEHPSVYAKLQNNPLANPKELGVKKHLPFPAGAILVTCSSQDSAEKLGKVARDMGIELKTPQARLPMIKIHRIPNSTTLSELEDTIDYTFGKRPASINLVPYTLNGNKDNSLSPSRCRCPFATK